jgi:hypothetical protein
MPHVPIDLLPDDARAWVFAASDVTGPEQEALLLREVDAFLAEWRAHGVPLRSARDWRDGRFLCIAVDQRTEGASGCSVDGLFRTLRALEPELGTSLVGGGQVFWRDADGLVQRATREQFAAHAVTGQITGHTPVFDVTITSLGDWRTRFEQPAAASWHARLLGAARG